MKTYCYKLYQNKMNKRLHQAINVAGIIYNHCIALHKRYYRLYGKSLGLYRLQKHITKLKKRPKYAFWTIVGSQAIQDIAQRIDRAYKLFFRNRKSGIRTAPPSFQKVRKYRSFTLKQAGYRLLDGNKVLIQGKVYKYFKSRDIEGKIKTVTVKRDALGNIYIYFVCEKCENLVLPRTGNSVGLDFGLKTFLVGSDGLTEEAPQFFTKAAKTVKRLNRSLSRKKKSSSNRKRAKLELSRAHRKIANRRRDYHFKLAARLAGAYALICVEDLNLKAMQRLWGRKSGDLGHGQFLGILAHQCPKAGATLVKIPRFEPTSKTCSVCGHMLGELPLTVRAWQCPDCGAKHDRDSNAAKNILRVETSTHGREGIRPA